MSELDFARTVRHAVGNAGDPRDVLLVVGPRTGDQLAAPSQDSTQRSIERGDDR